MVEHFCVLQTDSKTKAAKRANKVVQKEPKYHLKSVHNHQ